MSVQDHDNHHLPPEEAQIDSMLRDFFRREIPREIADGVNFDQRRLAVRRRTKSVRVIVSAVAGLAAVAIALVIPTDRPTESDAPAPLATTQEFATTESTESAPATVLQPRVPQPPAIAERPADSFSESPLFVIGDEAQPAGPIRPVTDGASSVPSFAPDGGEEIEIFSIEDPEAGSSVED
ncbi:hypothetical protein [Stratiformator vulcanicus]|uniref:Uncharacterized protein n=1 Tax=Stratiformator vulcanicus TaxID=2527980 RepID=A0A517QZQ5_9PLAN|nr:hypothetical protein [Stratiformator vulcanicus]QDT37126.1 hypothetical protein Pan189_14940 [Stratiformator vulcanicus]